MINVWEDNMRATWRVAAIGCVALSASTLAQTATPPASTIDQLTPVAKAVKHCSDVVRAKPDAWSQKFDAFYNPASRKVENNATMVGDQQPLFEFNKCMTEMGFPLTY